MHSFVTPNCLSFVEKKMHVLKDQIDSFVKSEGKKLSEISDTSLS